MFPQSLHPLISAGYYLCKVYKASHSPETPFPPTRCLSRVPFRMFPPQKSGFSQEKQLRTGPSKLLGLNQELLTPDAGGETMSAPSKVVKTTIALVILTPNKTRSLPYNHQRCLHYKHSSYIQYLTQQLQPVCLK